MASIIGIDLGTTNSCLAVLEGGEPRVIHNDLGARTTPSIVALNEANEVLVGAAAKRQAAMNPKSTIYGIKRLIGRKYDSESVAELKRTMPFEIFKAPNGDAWIRVQGQELSPQEVSAHVLVRLRKTAEDYLGETITQAIVTVPAYFDDAQRQATKDAGRIAGLEVMSILNEPTAAALAYGVQKGLAAQTIAVFDLGGGTFDISILRLDAGVFEVLATAGDTFLGGDDFDRRVMELLISEFKDKHGVDLAQDAVALQRLKEAAERAKQELSSSMTTEIHLPFLAVKAEGPLHLMRELSRAQLESLTRPLLERLEVPCRRAMEDAGVTAKQIDQVVLVGGMTRMRAVETRAVEIFGKQPVKGVNPDEVVAVGAATQSGIMSGSVKDVVLLDVTPHALGIRVESDRFSPIIARNAMVPAREQKIFTTTEDDQDFVSIEVFQGESDKASGNRMLGRFVLGDLPRASAGSVQVQVSFMIDADGVLNVDAKEMRSGKATSKKILASSGLSRDEVGNLKERFAARGRKRRDTES